VSTYSLAPVDGGASTSSRIHPGVARATAGILLAGVALVLGACANNPAAPADTSTSGAATVVSVQLSPSPLSLMASQSTGLSAMAKDAYGNPVTVQLTWSSSDSSVATVDNEGTVTGITAGDVTIQAAVGGVTGSADVTVQADTTGGSSSQAPVASVAVSPSADTLAAGDSVNLTATPTDASGNTVYGVPIGWSSSDTAVATVSGGEVHALKAGSVTISAVADSVTGTATILVH